MVDLDPVQAQRAEAEAQLSRPADDGADVTRADPQPGRCRRQDDVHVAVQRPDAASAAPGDLTQFPAGVRAGIGTADSPDRSWREARTALRFTTPRQPVVHHADLGALALLAQIPEDAVRDNADVAAIALMAGDPDDLGTPEAYCATGSQRQAADSLHLHHSSVARRLEQIGKALGIELTEPTGLTRARLALIAWRLLNE